MSELSGLPEFRPQIQQIPMESVDAQIMAKRVQEDLRPGETRYARTGPGVPMPETYTVENADFILHARIVDRSTGAVDITFLTSFNHRMSVELLTGLIAQLSAVTAHHHGATAN